jgi:hypothetical protein
LSRRKKNDKGETLLSYEKGFTWCEQCQYVSDIAPQSDLNLRSKLRGCQRPSCPGSTQWKNHYQSPYFDEDFVYEGYKVVKPCLLYENGTGCPEGNKCINSNRKKWDEKLKENANRCYVCGPKAVEPQMQIHHIKVNIVGLQEEAKTLKDSEVK